MSQHDDGGPATLPPLTLEAAARQVGAFAWIERRCFEIIGSWVPAVPEPEPKLRLGEDAYHHAWHAELWTGRLPKLRELAAEDFVAAPGPAVAALLDAVAAPTGTDQTIEKLVGIYRVLLPRKIAAYEAHGRTLSPLTDGPTERARSLVVHDERADWHRGELLVQSLLTTPERVERASRHQAALETLVVAAGGLMTPPAP